MIKLRLHGTPDEVKKLADYLETLSNVRVLQRSDSYADRGKSVYVRVYMDVAVSETERKLAELADEIEAPNKSDVIAKIVAGEIK
ncbi:MAG: hypothetical protein K2K60_01235 [Clostridia bacterium]|nr:hypothetical protein [Clostridia bacterium]